MKNPLELMKYRLSELNQEYVRVYNVSLNQAKYYRSDRGKERYKSFYTEREKAMDFILDMIKSYEETIRILDEINGV